jgi:hypothetical protein
VVLRYMLINEHNGDVLPLIGEIVEGGFYGRGFCFCVDDEKVLLGIWWGCYVLYKSVVS